mgnify:CR=1 FL=1
MKLILKKITNTIRKDNEVKKIEFHTPKGDLDLKLKLIVEGSKDVISDFMQSNNLLGVEGELDLLFNKVNSKDKTPTFKDE